MKIDCFTHVMPSAYAEALKQEVGGYGELAKLHKAMPALFDMDLRIASMDRLGIDQQVITLAAPPVEVVADDPDLAAKLAAIANDGIAEMANRDPDRFIPVGNIAMNNMSVAVAETRRCIEQLGMKGMLIYSSDRRRAIDTDRFMPFYDLMADYDLPIWIHPAREPDVADYIDEDVSEYVIWQVFGWPYETTAAMTRLVFSGVFDRHPNIKFITHHAGAMAPFFDKRIESVYPLFTSANPKLREQVESMNEPVLNYFKKFYGDTALMGSVGGLTNALTFFGSDHLLFGTDAPFDLQGGDQFTVDTVTSIEALPANEKAKQEIYSGNLQRMLRLDS